jgi:hypothetical protein
MKFVLLKNELDADGKKKASTRSGAQVETCCILNLK